MMLAAYKLDTTGILGRYARNPLDIRCLLGLRMLKRLALYEARWDIVGAGLNVEDMLTAISYRVGIKTENSRGVDIASTQDPAERERIYIEKLKNTGIEITHEMIERFKSMSKSEEN